MEDYAAALGLMHNQVRDWFVEKRKRDKRENDVIVPSHSSSCKKFPVQSGKSVLGVAASRRIHTIDPSNEKANAPSSSRNNVTRNGRKKKKHKCLQELFTVEYILKKVYLKDGPPLGQEFDSLPSGAFLHLTGPKNFTPASQEDQGPTKRRKVTFSVLTKFTKGATGSHPDFNKKAPVTKHGIGKGLMTVWRATNPDAGDLPIGFGFVDREVRLILNSTLQSQSVRTRGHGKQ